MQAPVEAGAEPYAKICIVMKKSTSKNNGKKYR